MSYRATINSLRADNEFDRAAENELDRRMRFYENPSNANWIMWRAACKKLDAAHRRMTVATIVYLITAPGQHP